MNFEISRTKTLTRANPFTFGDKPYSVVAKVVPDGNIVKGSAYAPHCIQVGPFLHKKAESVSKTLNRNGY